MPGTLPSTVSAIFVMPSPGWNVTVAEVCSSSGGVPAFARPCRERHREARGVRGGDQLLRARLAAGLVLGARRPAHADARRTRRSSSSRSSPLPSIRLPVPGHVCPASVAMSLLRRRKVDRVRYAMHFDALRVGVRRPRGASTSRSARIETSSWSSVGSRVVSRCSQSPGASSVISDAVVLVLAREADQLVREAGDQRQQQDPRRDQPVPGRPAEEREDEDRDHHHPEQERRAAARVDERVALHGLRLELLARLVRVDRLVLGGVVLEDAPQVGQERDERRGRRRRSSRGSAPRRSRTSRRS